MNPADEDGDQTVHGSKVPDGSGPPDPVLFIGYPTTVRRFTGGEVRKLAETTIERAGAFHNPCPLYPARLTRAEGLQVIRVLRGSDGRSTRRPRRGSGR